jgi:hypothetical protein
MPDPQPESKIVRVTDVAKLLESFKDIDHLNLADRLVLDAGLKVLASRIASQENLSKNGDVLFVDKDKPDLLHLYVSSKFIDNTVDEMLKSPGLNDNQRAILRRLDQTLDHAVQAAPDQTEKLKTGKIKPVSSVPRKLGVLGT